jgi:sec-independent protein translocase protein TatB
MFDVSFSELVLILVVGLLVFGPEKLPEVIRSVSAWIGKLRRGFNQIRNEIEREVGIDELKREIHNQSIIDSFKDVHDELRTTQQDLQHLPYDVREVLERNHAAPSVEIVTPEPTTSPATTTPTISPAPNNSSHSS